MKQALTIGLLFVVLASCGSDENPVPEDEEPAPEDEEPAPAEMDGEACRKAKIEFEAAYEALDRSCDVENDCVWYHEFGACRCPTFGNANADKSALATTNARQNETCSYLSGSDPGAMACGNNLVCLYNPVPRGSLDPEGHVLRCEERRCVAVREVDWD